MAWDSNLETARKNCIENSSNMLGRTMLQPEGAILRQRGGDAENSSKILGNNALEKLSEELHREARTAIGQRIHQICYVRKNNAATRGSNLETAWRSCKELIKHFRKTNTFKKQSEQLHGAAIIAIGQRTHQIC